MAVMEEQHNTSDLLFRNVSFATTSRKVYSNADVGINSGTGFEGFHVFG
jgi:hypothetical protein